MGVETKAGWIYAVRELAKALDDAGVQLISSISGLQGELDSINTLIGDVASALDAINGEVV